MIVSLVLLTYFLTIIGLHYDNIGSRTGLVLSILGIYTATLTEKSKEQWKKHQNMLILLKCIASAILILAMITTGFMIHGGNPYQDSSRTVIILGSGVDDDGRPTVLMQSRIDAALPYIRSHPDTAIIVSGGIMNANLPSEASSMKETLMEQNIDEKRIYTEDQSTSTYENLQNSAEIIRKEGLNPEVLIATNEFHQYRAGYFAEKEGLKPMACKAQTPWYLLPVVWIYEMYGILHAWIFGM